MNLEYIKDIIEKNYEIKVSTVEKVKGSYKLNGDLGYSLKIVKYEFPHFYFILSAMKHLENKGFSNIIPIIKSKENKDYIELKDRKYAYLTKWIPSRISDFSNLEELYDISKTIGELHSKSRGFTITPLMRPRIYWFSWIKVFETRREEILDFANRISQKAYKNNFDNIFLDNLNEELDRASKSVEGLKKSKYISVMERELMERGFCHHDLANHNILIGEDKKINIIDFDYCILDSKLHDLSSLLIRGMKNNKWDRKTAEIIIKGYSENNPLSRDEFNIMKEFLRFPQEFWQIGLQVYWEQQPWGEEYLTKKLNKYLKERDERENFIESFF